MMRVEKLTAHIGAEVSGVDLAEAAANDDLFGAVKEALLQHKVLFLRNQDIAKADHVAFAHRFGALEDHPVAGSDPEHPGLVCIYKDLDSPPDFYENAWHCDATWRDCPPMGAVLRCLECPPVGGDTLWANMARAYADLPDHCRRKRSTASMRVHSIEASFGARMPDREAPALKAQYPDAEHPVVRTHPETGEKVLFVNSFRPTSPTSTRSTTSATVRTTRPAVLTCSNI
jgi:taurine dioxygenase